MERQEFPYNLQPKTTTNARVLPVGEGAYRLEIPPGPQGQYRLAQLDDYDALPRRSFPWTAPGGLSLRARASSRTIPGTWGFGFWNDPFGMALVSGVERLRLPNLPNAAWFFFASPPNYLSLYDDLPAQGWLAATFRSRRFPAPLLALGAPGLPLALLPPTGRLLRRLARPFVRQAAVRMEVDPTEWHSYSLAWQAERAVFSVDGEEILRTPIAPQGRLGLVLWVDNQYAALPPSGRFRMGTLAAGETAWLEMANIRVGPEVLS